MNNLWSENQRLIVIWSRWINGSGTIRLLKNDEIVCETPYIIRWGEWDKGLTLVSEALKEYGVVEDILLRHGSYIGVPG